jgi:hypothetical protein
MSMRQRLAASEREPNHHDCCRFGMALLRLCHAAAKATFAEAAKAG